jgi:hypothetical protein
VTRSSRSTFSRLVRSRGKHEGHDDGDRRDEIVDTIFLPLVASFLPLVASQP